MCSPLQPDSLVPLNKHIESEPVATGDYEKAFQGVKLAELVHQRRVWVTRGQTLGLWRIPLCCRGSCGEKGGSLLEGGGCPQSDLSRCCAAAIWTRCCASASSSVTAVGTSEWHSSPARSCRSAGAGALREAARCCVGAWHMAGDGWEQSACAQQTLLSILSFAAEEIKEERWMLILRKVSWNRTKRVWTKQAFLLQDCFCRLQPRLFSEELLYPPHLQAACLGSHWHSAFLL